MEWRDGKKVTLSKSILEMKFMKRTKEKVDQQAYQQEGEEYFNKQGLSKQRGKFLSESSYIHCEQLIDGRLSFHGENPEIEKIMELEEKNKKKPPIKNKDETDVSDVQMANAWKSTTKINVNNIVRTHENSNQPKRKKPKFLKPKD